MQHSNLCGAPFGCFAADEVGTTRLSDPGGSPRAMNSQRSTQVRPSGPMQSYRWYG
jgi:hypothetical protein